MFFLILAPSSTTLKNRVFSSFIKKYLKKINICWMQTRTGYGTLNINIEFRAKESEAQRDWVTCIRSQSEYTAKSESELHSLKS